MHRLAPLACSLLLAIAAGLWSPTIDDAAAGAFPGGNGRIAFVSNRDGNSEIYSMARDGTDQQRLTANTGIDLQPAWSPDGGSIAYISGATLAGAEIWVMGADGSDPVQLTGSEGAADSSPAWSPDGTQIAFVSNRSAPGGGTTGPEIWVMNADGSGVRQLTSTSPGASQAPAWSPDGSTIAFHSTGDGEFEIYTIAADSTPGATSDARVKLTHNFLADQNPSWSPDGSRIAFERGSGTSVGDTSKEIWVMDADGADASEVKLTANADYDVQPSWSPDGTRIAFESDAGADGDREIVSMPVSAGAAPTNLTTTTSGIADENPDWGVSDVTPPAAPRITGGPTGTTGDDTPTFTFSTDAGTSGQCRLERTGAVVSDWSPCSRSRTYDLSGQPEGAYTFRVRAVDPAGNTGPEATRAFTLDRPDPPPPPPPPPPPGPGPGGPGPTPPPPMPIDEGPKASCSEPVGFGVIQVLGCLERVGDSWVTRGTVSVNGVSLVPTGDTRLTVDLGEKRLHSGGGEFTLYVGPFAVYRGVIDWRLASATGVNISPMGGARLGGMPLAGLLRLEFVRGRAVQIKGAIHTLFLQALQRFCRIFCPGVTADVSAVTDNDTSDGHTGLRLGGLKLDVRNVQLGLAVVERLQAGYDPALRAWRGTGALRMTFPQPTRVTTEWVFDETRVRSATANLRSLSNTIALGVVLRRLDLALHTSPFQFAGGMTIAAGPLIRGRAAVTADGSFLMRPAGIGPVTAGGVVRVEGSLQIVDVPVATGHVQLWPAGGFDVAARISMGLPDIRAAEPRRQPVYVGASIAGWSNRGSFNLEGAAEVLVYGASVARGELVVSSVGFAACGKLGWLRGGAARRWGERPAILAGACDVGPYRARAAAARAAQGGPLTLRLRDAPAGAVLRFRGAGGPPLVVLEGPGGRRIVAPADGAPLVTQDFVVLRDAEGSATHVAIRRAAGTWRVTTAPGSAPLAGVDSADVLERPDVSARVSRRRGRRVLTWRLDARPGQRVTFVERGTDTARVITRTTRSRGRVTFTPAQGAIRSRRIVAVVEQSGVPRDTLAVARYTAPPWSRPKRPQRLRVRRRAGGLDVTWRRVAGAAGYTAVVTAADGEREVFRLGRTRTRLRVPGVAARHRATVQVAALRSDGAAGPRATVRVRPVSSRRRR